VFKGTVEAKHNMAQYTTGCIYFNSRHDPPKDMQGVFYRCPVILSKKCRMNVSQVLNIYRDMGI
jgi:hypothetical protein